MKTKITICACIATLNSEKHWKECLNAVVNQKTKFDEIIIVDDSSTDNTIKITETILKKTGIPYKIFIKKPEYRDIALSRNICMKESKCEYLAYIDSDTVISNNWVQKMREAIITKNPLALVVGYMIESTSRFSKYLYVPSTNEPAKDFRKSRYYSATSFASTIIKKRILKSVNGFKGKSMPGEDADVILRIKKKYPNFKFYSVGGTTVKHYSPPTFIQNFKKFYKWGQGNMRTAISNKTPFTVKKAFILASIPFIFMMLIHPIFLAIGLIIPLLYFLFALRMIYKTKYYQIRNLNFIETLYVSLNFVLYSYSFGFGALSKLTDIFKKQDFLNLESKMYHTHSSSQNIKTK
ncbi:MAG: glycosyltransferase [Nanoarchaeota archaeon]|nr:glycosyltransferase [Nanoarchaeota archaeon]